MRNDDRDRKEQEQAWFKHNKAFIILVMLVPLSIACVLAVFLLHSRNSPANTFVVFTVRSYSSNQTFPIAVEVNITDGMSRSEAIVVTSEVFEKVLDFGPQYERSIHITETFEDNSVWTVRLSWAFGSMNPRASQPHGSFVSIVYPQNRTVVYEAHYGF